MKMVLKYVKTIIFFGKCTFGCIFRYCNIFLRIRYAYSQIKYHDTISMNLFASSIYCLYSDRQAPANSVDLDEMLQILVSQLVYTVCHSSGIFRHIKFEISGVSILIVVLFLQKNV